MKPKKWSDKYIAKLSGVLAIGCIEKRVKYLDIFDIDHLLVLYEDKPPISLLKNLAAQLSAQGVNTAFVKAGSDLTELHADCLQRLYSGNESTKLAVIVPNFESLDAETRNELLTLATISRQKGIAFLIAGAISQNTQAAAAIAVYAPFGVLICEQGSSLTYMWGKENEKLTRFVFSGKRRVKNGT